jgi:hypothetical protein
LWEAFLLQMNDFDRYLEIELKLMLDPVVVRRPPTRKGRKEAPALLVLPVAEALAVEPIPVAEPALVVTFPAAAARAL